MNPTVERTDNENYPDDYDNSDYEGAWFLIYGED